MKKLILYYFVILIFLLNFYSFSCSWEELNTIDSQFTIDKIDIIDDRNLLIHFSKDLAIEPINMELKSGENEIIQINSISVWTWSIWSNMENKYSTWSRQEVYVFTASKLKHNTTYYVIVKNARSMDWLVITQDKDTNKDILNTQKIETGDNITKSTQSLDVENVTPVQIVHNSTEENSSETTINNISTNSEENSEEIIAWNNLEAAPVVKINNLETQKKQNDLININNTKILPKTWPELFLLFLATIFISWSIFLIKKNFN